MNRHEVFMRRALDLAEHGRATTSPNPMVGCVIVQNGEIVGEGWHKRAGEPHAEVHALRNAGEKAKGAIVYVTLEPCNHQGRTPACTEALINTGVSEVIIAATDPNPQVNGKGIKRLQAHGIEVRTGILQREAEQQNEVFRVVQEKRRPYTLYKTAMTLDGKIATRTGESRWITGQTARNWVQQKRHELDAIAVGVRTVLLDNPQLTSRIDGGHSPVKIIFDSVARTPPSAKLFDDDLHGQKANVIIYVTAEATPERIQALQERGAEVVTMPDVRGQCDVNAALKDLHKREMRSLLLEGGGSLAWSFFEAKAIDKVAWFIAPKLLGGKGSSPLGGLGVAAMEDAISLDDLQTERMDDDLLITGHVRYAENWQADLESP